ncbi:Ran GAP Rna1 [Pyricularia oryzae]
MVNPDKVFTLEGRALKLDTAEDLDAHIAALKAMDDVEEVRILGNTLGIGACKRLGEVLSTKNNLQVANLADIFTGRLLNEIPEALTHLLTQITNLPNLTTVNLNDNAFGINTYKPVADFLSSHVPLQHLYLNNNGLGPEAGMYIADALSELYDKKEQARKEGRTDVPDLETVICGRNRLENGSMKAWAKAFSKHDKLKEVKMVQNGIRQEGITHLLTEGLSNTLAIQVLDLQDNTFTITGATALAKIAPTWTDLRELGVSDSYLGAKGGRLLSRALAKGKNEKLETLRMQYNDMNARTLKSFADTVKDGLPALKKIEINGNKLSEDDVSIAALQKLLEARKEKAGGDVLIEEEWGVDSLSDLEDDSDEEEEEESEEEAETEEEIKKTLDKDEKEAKEPATIKDVASKEVDEITQKLRQTGI